VQRALRFALGLVCGLLPLHAATLERLSLDDLIAKSTAIVRGTVSGSYAAFRGPIIFTHYTVQVSEPMKGSRASTLDVVVPGGTANNLRQLFSGTPQLKNGDQFVFFLWTGPSGLTQIMGLTQGLFRLSSDSAGGVVATRAASTELMLDPATGRPVKDQTLIMSLSQLRSRIAGRVQRGATQ
jgi:hypothetical protein